MEEKQRCFYLESGRMFTPDGEVRPCCRFDTSVYKESFRWDTQEDYFSSLKENPLTPLLKKDPRQIKGCHKCFQEEATGLKSMRQKANASLEDSPGVLRALEIAVGRICNLKCRSCGPKYSTKWDSDAKQLGLPKFSGASQFPLHAIPDELLTHIQSLKISGGEPLLHDGLCDFLDRVLKLQKADSVKLELYTNGTVKPSKKLIDLLSHFANLNLLVSVDATEAQNTYLRPPMLWKDFSDTVDFWLEKQTDFSFNFTFATTVSSFSLLSIKDIIFWANEKIESPSIDIVFQMLQDPKEMSLFFLPNPVKNLMANEFAIDISQLSPILNLNPILKKRLESIQNTLGEENSMSIEIEKIFYEINKLDLLRGESFKSVFPNVEKIFRQVKTDCQVQGQPLLS